MGEGANNMYIYLIDPAGKEYIMYQNQKENQTPSVDLSAKYENFNKERNEREKETDIIKNIKNKNKEKVDINYLLMAIESHFINISLFYLKYIFLNKNNFDIVDLFKEPTESIKNDFINTFENDTHFVYKIGEISNQSYFTGVTSIENTYSDTSASLLKWKEIGKLGYEEFSTKFKTPTLFRKEILKYFKSAPYQKDGGVYKREQPLHFIHWLKDQIATHESHFFISLHTVDSRIKNGENVGEKKKKEIKHKIDTELKDIIKFIDHSAINNIKSCEATNSDSSYPYNDWCRGLGQTITAKSSRFDGGRLTLKKKHLFNNKKRKTLKKKHMFN